MSEQQGQPERRHALRADVELPLAWCVTPGRLDTAELAARLGIQGWHRQAQLLEQLEPLSGHIDQVQDVHAAAALRVLEAAVRGLAEPAETPMIGEPTRLNLSAEGLSFCLAERSDEVLPRSWLGVAIGLPQGAPVLANLEVVWTGDTSDQMYVGGRFQHLDPESDRRLSRFLLLQAR